MPRSSATRIRTPVLLVAVLALAVPRPAPAVEPWAHPDLPVQDGLELWLDAARQPEARAAAGAGPLVNGSRLETWYDASGRKRHVAAPAADSRPEWATIAAVPVVRFDGQDDCLRLTGQGAELQGFTIVFVIVPRSNHGEFRGWLAFNAPNERDYTSGLTIDHGPAFSTRFDSLNVEGRGFGGAHSLMTSAASFGTAHIVEVRSDVDGDLVSLTVDGEPAGVRPRQPGPISMDEITVGARFYTNGPGPQQARGFSQADIAEVLVYNRGLSNDELTALRGTLDTRYAELKAAARPQLGSGLVTVDSPPALQMLQAGFEARRLPLDLPNINNVRCRPNGTLLAVAYNGDMYVLSDTDGDGLEDRADLFWDNKGSLRAPIGMALTPPGYAHGNGAFITAKGKVALIVDTDGDNVADREIVVATGWKELAHGVDALGTAFDPTDGSVYFGIGCGDFTNAYEIDREGKAHYVKDDRATVLRASPDFSSYEVVATGVRFAVGMAFNARGDLFCTDQEGATWLPNGNPFDELLQIQRGRHYGFPPRHPKWLPDVIDEPSVYDYGPQHQSACGLVFNEPVAPGDPTFGPEAWRGNALIAGYSRGKLYRTELTPTDAGYVARSHVLANLTELTVDLCVDRQGALVVATHSGGPDWGSGPGGQGQLYKVTWRDRDLPQPTLVWPAARDEVRVAFDRPLDSEQLRGMASRGSIQWGAAVRAGDRFETLRPGYASVGAQLLSPRFEAPVRSLQVSADGRTLLVVTDSSAVRVPHALTLPAEMLGARGEPKPGGIEQHPEFDLDYDLSGVEAHWQPAGEGLAWRGWLPHLQTSVAREMTAGSAFHDALWSQLAAPGQLTFDMLLDPRNMLRPEVQPGSKIDYEWPAETVTFSFEANAPLRVECDSGVVEQGPETPHAARLIIADATRPLPVRIRIDAASGDPRVTVAWHTAEDATPRALPLHRLQVPWSEDPQTSPESFARTRAPELEGGSWARGRQVFFSEAAACFKCHSVHGKGGDSAPNLSNLIHRDYASVLRDVADPSFAINPDFTTFLIEDRSGRVLSGTMQTVGEEVRVTDQQGRLEILQRHDIEQIVPGKISNMPTGIPQQLGEERLRDLLTFLLTPPPQMPQDGPGPPPPARTRQEVDAVLAGAPEPTAPPAPVRITLVAGPKDHGPGEHDYPAWQSAWSELLQAMPETVVTTAMDWPSDEDLAESDVLVFYQRGDWTTEREQALDAYFARGGGAVYIHYAVDGGARPAEFAERIGLAWQGGRSKFRHGPLDLTFNRGGTHPVARNFDRLELVDESYWQLLGSLPADRVLATGLEDGAPQPLFWTHDSGRGRVFVSIPGHFSWSFDDPLFRVLLLRGIAWSAGQPVDRFNEAVWIGSRIVE
ncbi:MAG: ThuA domain-containing protein [Planctomyces sp.]|nr:ThuA domain-containing protein [Planctomyces sp.]